MVIPYPMQYKKEEIKYPILVKGDLSGFWALFADNLANMIILSSILIGVVKLPTDIVYGHVIPGVGISLILGLLYYSYLAKRLALKEGRTDVTALPYGISTPVMFAYLFGIVVPVAQKTGDATIAWKVGIASAFIGGIIEVSGSIIGPWLKKNLPRASMLGTLAGIALVYIATVPMAEIYEDPIVGFPAMAIIVIGLIARQTLPLNLPAGFLAIILGVIIGGIKGEVKIVTEELGVYLPLPVLGDLIEGLKILFREPELLGVIIPVEIYNFLETMNNVESAEAEGDSYPVGRCQIVDGLGTIFGSIFGSIFPTTVYIGHPGYKRLGARRGYTLGVGTVMFLVALFGLISFLYHLIPISAVAPILVYIGIIITAQAFERSPKKHAIAVAIAIIPHVSNILITKLNSLYNGVKSLGVNLPELSSDKMLNILISQGVHYTGHSLLSNGAIITGMLWGAIVAFLIETEYVKVELTILIALILSYLGIIHKPGLSSLFIGYGIMGIILLYYVITKRIKKEETTQQ